MRGKRFDSDFARRNSFPLLAMGVVFGAALPVATMFLHLVDEGESKLDAIEMLIFFAWFTFSIPVIPVAGYGFWSALFGVSFWFLVGVAVGWFVLRRREKLSLPRLPANEDVRFPLIDSSAASDSDEDDQTDGDGAEDESSDQNK